MGADVPQSGHSVCMKESCLTNGVFKIQSVDLTILKYTVLSNDSFLHRLMCMGHAPVGMRDEDQSC